jgi:probable poly-beta-1,6-N-acetyl-D-glucosamine export protein
MIRRLLQLNGLAIMGVVLNHTIGWGFVAMFWWTHQYLPVSVPNFDQMGTPAYYSLRTAEQIVIASIPIFLFVSGFFVAVATGRNNSTIGWSTVGRRIVALFIPYVLWSVIIFTVDFVLLGERHAPLHYLLLLGVGGATEAYYYVPLLIQLYLLSPFLVPLAKQHWKMLLGVTLLMQVYVQLADYQILVDESLWLMGNNWIRAYSWSFPGYIFWFSFGTVVGFHLTQFKEWLARYKWVLLPASILMLPLGMLEWELLLHLSGQEWLAPVRVFSDELFSGTLILCFLAFSNFTLPFSGRLSELGTKSYGIYLVHSLVLVWTAKIIYRFEPWILSNQLLYQPILFALGLGIPLLLMELVRRSPVRKYYQYIFG